MRSGGSGPLSAGVRDRDGFGKRIGLDDGLLLGRLAPQASLMRVRQHGVAGGDAVLEPALAERFADRVLTMAQGRIGG